jgi:putative bacteriocin precursor
MYAAYKLGRTIRTALLIGKILRKEDLNVKKLNKDNSSMENTVEAYASMAAECTCSCPCYGNTTAMYGAGYGVGYNEL